MLTDLLLAIAHHLLVFGLLGLLITEMMTIRPGMSAASIRYVAKLDIAYGIVAGLIVIVGFSRVFFGIKGADFYLANPVFWAKMAAFLILDPGFRPADAEVKKVRRYMHYEGMAFFTIPVFAALMARGYGL
jgi:putative membrane protein